MSSTPPAPRNGRRIGIDDARAEAERLLAAGRFAPAEGLARAVLRLRPEEPASHLLLARVLDRSGNADAAIDSYAAALALDSGLPRAAFRRANLLRLAGRAEEAVAAYRSMLDRTPDHVDGWINLGVTLHGLARWAEAATAWERARMLDPRRAETHKSLGMALERLGRLDDAETALRTAIAAEPDHPGAHLNLALLRLRRGDLAEGFREYAWRLRTPSFPARPRRFGRPQWDGGDPAGRTILLHAEQGMGDAIQFLRYAAPIAARGARLLLEIHRPLLALVRRLPGNVATLPLGAPLPPFDMHASLVDLPAIMGTSIETIPADIPYLDADPERVAAWRERLGGGVGLRVGLVWAGNPDHPNDRARSLPPAALAPLFEVPAVRLFSLQVGPGAAGLAALPAARITDIGPALTDFAETAAAMAALDLIVTVDTAPAHLAGALGRPVWTLIADPADWRWMLERTDSPWYPTMRLFRQTRAGDWAEPVRAVAAALRALAPR